MADPEQLEMQQMKRILMAATALTLLPACGPGAPEAGGEPSNTAGRLVIVGGALDRENTAIYQAVLEGRSGDGPICVIPTASSVPAESMASAVEVLSGYGGEGSAKGVLLSTEAPERARDPQVASELEGCSGFYFTGGSQSRILDVFLPAGDTTEAYRAVWSRWQAGAVVAGSSAGAAMMSRVMISGGGSDEAMMHGVTWGPEADGVQLQPGMGFFEPILDQHFLARGRIGRLIVAVLDGDTPPVGLGIDENTALVVDGGAAEVVGASGVIVVDGRESRPTQPDGAGQVMLRLAGAGDVLDLQTLRVTRGEEKTPLLRGPGGTEPPDAPFDRWAFLHLIQGLASSPDEEATFDLDGARLRIREGAGFTASSLGPSGGAEGTPAGLSAGPFVVELVRAGA